MTISLIEAPVDDDSYPMMLSVLLGGVRVNPFLPNTDFNGFLTRGIARNTNNTTKQDLFQKPVKK